MFTAPNTVAAAPEPSPLTAASGFVYPPPEAVMAAEVTDPVGVKEAVAVALVFVPAAFLIVTAGAEV